MLSLVHSRRSFIALVALVLFVLCLLSSRHSKAHSKFEYYQHHQQSSRASTHENSNRLNGLRGRHTHLHSVETNKSSENLLHPAEGYVAAVPDTEDYFQNATSTTQRDLLIPRATIDFGWYKCKGAKLLQMIQDNQRPIFLPRDLSDWAFGTPLKQDREHGVNGLAQPMLDQLGYANLKAGDFVSKIASQREKFKLNRNTYVSFHQMSCILSS